MTLISWASLGVTLDLNLVSQTQPVARSFSFKLFIFYSIPLLFPLAFNAQGIFQFSAASSVVHKYFSCLKPGSKLSQIEIPKICNTINFCARYSLGKQKRQNPWGFPSNVFGWFSSFIQNLLAQWCYPSWSEEEGVHLSPKDLLGFKYGFLFVLESKRICLGELCDLIIFSFELLGLSILILLGCCFEPNFFNEIRVKKGLY